MEFLANTSEGRLYTTRDIVLAIQFKNKFNGKMDKIRKGVRTFFVTL